MRVFCSFPTVKVGNDEPFESWIDRDFSDALIDLGHQLVKFPWNLPASKGYENWLEKNKEHKNIELINCVKKNHEKKPIDLYLSCNDNRYIFPKTIEEIKDLGILTVNYNCDDVNAFHLLEDVAPHYDYNWTNQLNAIPKYKNISAAYIYTPFGANPKIYRQYDINRKYDITFVGRNIGYREEFIQHIKNAGYNIKVWGFGWPRTSKDIVHNFCFIAKRTKLRNLNKQIKHTFWNINNYHILKELYGSPLSFTNLIKMYSQSKISLNFSGGFDFNMYDFSKANKSMKLRDMEATMSGAFYLTEYSKEISTLFSIGEEIACFNGKDEMLQQIEYYLQNPHELEEIRKAGRNKALKNYTWKNHIEMLFNNIKI